MFNVSSNPRVNESMNLICNAFLNLAREKNYSAISITEICSRASVARKTLYRNFETKEDIINCILFHKMGEITDKMNATDEPYQTFCCFMNNWKKTSIF